eukprot:NODE_4117_length_607_cov_231.620072_g2958_i0.p1 GENE.NODE_4117_length_607_cov_231.620072_g2958_i0~~NODE_4117_length_607_cov_231.620072_g2958_i0.p1  ORF type:complete len:138 (+),score=12.55 NODE_4117_length_607_cov_231.620072_g2958_i0:192-605(+)
MVQRKKEGCGAGCAELAFLDSPLGDGKHDRAEFIEGNLARPRMVPHDEVLDLTISVFQAIVFLALEDGLHLIEIQKAIAICVKLVEQFPQFVVCDCKASNVVFDFFFRAVFCGLWNSSHWIQAKKNRHSESVPCTLR